MFKKTKICKGLMLAFGGTIAIGALPNLAQAQRVEITGSSIRQISSESALPVTVLKTEDLAKAGVTNAEQALAFITSNQSSVNSAASVSGLNGGASYADLRGLGAARTLVLVNGKRMVNNSYDSGAVSAVDLNTIPYGAVDRIEVLNDGASAIYGSDAVAGVVNFITRREYQGLTVNGSILQPFSSGGGQNYDLGVTGGIGSLTDKGWNVFGSASYRVQRALPASSRSYANTGYIPSRGVSQTSAYTSPATYAQNGEEFNPSLPGCSPPTSLPVDGSCRFDYASTVDLIPAQDQLSLMAKGTYAVDTNNTVSLEYVQGNNKLTSVVAPTPLPLSMPTTNPFFPGGSGAGGVGGTPANDSPLFDPTSPIDVRWRSTPLGGRSNTIENKTDRFLLDWQGSYKGWDYSAAVLRSSSNIKSIFDSGYVNYDGIQAGVNGDPFPAGGAIAPWINPFGAQTTAGLAYLESQQIQGQLQRSEGVLQGIKLEGSGEIYKLPAGPLSMAVGLEYYRDKVSYTNNFDLISQAFSSGLEDTVDSAGSRSWTGLFVEFNIPITKELEANLALRYDDYSDFGSTTNPKASFRWIPTKELLFRGSYNTGFRAPSLFEAYSPTSITNTAGSYNDPVLCPGGNVDAAAGGVDFRDCNTQFQRAVGGNQNLKPETSTAWGLGMVFQPTSAMLMSVDYWNYVVEDSIGPYGESVIFADSAKYANNFVRCSQVPVADQANYINCDGQGGDPIAYIIDTRVNLGTYKTSGLDLAATWRSAATDYGRFSVGWQATYILQYEYQLEAGGIYNNNLGVFFNGQPVSRYRQVLNFGWQQNAWTVNLINRYARGYTDENAVDPQYYNTVGAVNTWDLAVTWSGAKNTILTAGIVNLFNQDPPFSNQTASSQVGYDSRYANPIGRAFLLRATYAF